MSDQDQIGKQFFENVLDELLKMGRQRDDALQAMKEKKVARKVARALVPHVVAANATKPVGITTDIANLRLTGINLAALRIEGIITLGDLILRTEDEILDIRGIGGQKIEMIKTSLATNGYSLYNPRSAATANGVRQALLQKYGSGRNISAAHFIIDRDGYVARWVGSRTSEYLDARFPQYRMVQREGITTLGQLLDRPEILEQLKPEHQEHVRQLQRLFEDEFSG